MIKRIIFLLTLLSAIIFAEGFGQAKQQVFLKPEEAFKVNLKKIDKGLEANITLGKDIYIYQDSIKLNITKPVSKTIDVLLPEASEYHGQKIYENSLILNIPASSIEDISSGQYEISVAFEGCSKIGVCYSPFNKAFVFGNEKSGFLSKLTNLTTTSSMSDIAKAIRGESFWFTISLFFVVGLLLALTPCIFPMIPILSSIIISQSSNDAKVSMTKGFLTSLVYVVAMSLTYALVGVVAGMAGFDMQSAMQNPLVLILFALVFVALALSLFGFYEIGLPASWQTKISNLSDNASSKGGVIGTAIMGILSALIVGPCVAPALGGAILFISQSGDALLGGIALFVMSFGMGVPLLLVGLGAGKWMPRPGGWMTLVSRFFGVTMLLLAIIMISRITTPMVTMMLLAILSIGTSFGLYRNINLFSNKIVKTSAFIIVLFAASLGVVWTIGAFTGGVSALTPLKHAAQEEHLANAKRGYSIDRLLKETKGSDKPVIVDFTKESCSSCKELEVITFVDANVANEMKRFTFIQVDLTDNTSDDQEMLKYFGVFGTPNILFFDKEGNYIKDKTITGFISPEDFMKHLKSIK